MPCGLANIKEFSPSSLDPAFRVCTIMMIIYLCFSAHGFLALSQGVSVYGQKTYLWLFIITASGASNEINRIPFPPHCQLETTLCSHYSHENSFQQQWPCPYWHRWKNDDVKIYLKKLSSFTSPEVVGEKEMRFISVTKHQLTLEETSKQ